MALVYLSHSLVSMNTDEVFEVDVFPDQIF